MSDWKEFFKGKKVTQLGLGLLGRGLNDAIFLSKNVDELIVTDNKSADALKESVDTVIKESPNPENINFVLGEHRKKDFCNRDFILKGAGVPLDSEYVAEANKCGVPVYMDESLFFLLKPEGTKFIGVTGTRGKTTTSMMLQYILSNFLKNKSNVYLGGNIRGVATLPMLEKVKSEDVVVAELSSWQLQGFGDTKMSPSISIFTNLFEDHLNYYGGDMQSYFDDKSLIFKNQTKGDLLVVSEQADESIRKYFKNIEEIKSSYVVVDINKYSEILESLKIPGEHNKQNASLAISVAKHMGVDDEAIKDSLSSFNGAEGRMELIHQSDELEIYNDSTSTTPEALIVAVKTLSEIAKKRKNRLILIFGGADKELDFTEALSVLKEKVDLIITIPGSGTDKITPIFEQNEIEVVSVDNLSKSVYMAKNKLNKGDILLFSPGFASFGEFVNEFDRNDQFNNICSKIFAKNT